MLGKLFGRKRKSEPFDLSLIGVDMHSHLIPGIDDGSKSMDETIALLAKFQSLGYRKVITTPHIMSDYYRNTPEIIERGLEEVRATAKMIGLTIEIEVAAEYYFDDAFLQMIEDKKLLTFGGACVLVEFAFMGQPMFENEMFFKLISNGYTPVLAHFERYAFFHGSSEKAKEYRSRGVLIQMNLSSLSGHYGPEVRKQAERLIDDGLVDFVGTDCHRMQHLLALEENLALPYMHKLAGMELKNKQL
ncbi:MAG: tyrosine-protein phosphatase [Bacteroidota bacterium]|jgi:protein-tyrosine phosphatase